MTGGTLMPGHAPLKDHPFAELLPMLSDTELDELGADIAANGQAETIKLHKGLILDGRNRYRACCKRNLAVRYEVFTGSDREALNWVVSKNVRRRHLSESQRAMVAAKIAKLKLGDNQHTRQPAPIGAPALPGLPEAQETAPVASQSEAAEMLNVSRRSVQRAVEVEEHGAPELKQAVEQGRVAVAAAADLAQLPQAEQTQVAQLSDKEILAKAKEIRDQKNKKRRSERSADILKKVEASKSLPTGMKFPLLYLDPATKYAAGDSDRSTENHYPTMTEEEIAALPVGDLALEDAILFIWTTVPWLRKTIRILEGWGFEYKSCQCWDKVDIGTGFWWQNVHEILIVATRGKAVAPENGSILGRSIYSEKKGPHSAKPEYFRRMIDSVPEWQSWPKVELFARVDGELPPNWYAWGNEANVPAQQSLQMEAAE